MKTIMVYGLIGICITMYGNDGDKVHILYAKIDVEKCLAGGVPHDRELYDAILKSFDSHLTKLCALSSQNESNEKVTHDMVIHNDIVAKKYLMIQVCHRTTRIYEGVSREDDTPLFFSKSRIGDFLKKVSYITDIFESTQAFEEEILHS